MAVPREDFANKWESIAREIILWATSQIMSLSKICHCKTKKHLLNLHEQTMKTIQSLRLHMQSLPEQWQGPVAGNLVALGAHTQSDPWCHCPWIWCIQRLHLGVELVAPLADPQCQKNELEGKILHFIYKCCFISRKPQTIIELWVVKQSWKPLDATQVKPHFNKTNLPRIMYDPANVT